jgi:hypothetical protein
LQIAAPPLHW